MLQTRIKGIREDSVQLVLLASPTHVEPGKIIKLKSNKLLANQHNFYVLTNNACLPFAHAIIFLATELLIGHTQPCIQWQPNQLLVCAVSMYHV